MEKILGTLLSCILVVFLSQLSVEQLTFCWIWKNLAKAFIDLLNAFYFQDFWWGRTMNIDERVEEAPKFVYKNQYEN